MTTCKAGGFSRGIKNYSPVGLRQDVGALWENFLIVERLKFKAYNAIFSNDYFWRNQAQQEIDFVEEYDGVMHAYEFKWNAKRKTHFSKSFINAYPEHSLTTVNRDNHWEFIENGE